MISPIFLVYTCPNLEKIQKRWNTGKQSQISQIRCHIRNLLIFQVFLVYNMSSFCGSAKNSKIQTKKAKYCKISIIFEISWFFRFFLVYNMSWFCGSAKNGKIQINKAKYCKISIIFRISWFFRFFWYITCPSLGEICTFFNGVFPNMVMFIMALARHPN
jgi:hypothetical protein